jgi:hypothetical protein
MENLDQLEADIKEIVIDINNELKSLTSMPEEDIRRKNEEIKSMIHYFVDESNKMEDRRSKVSDSTWQTLGLIIAAFGILAAGNLIPLLKIPIIFVLFFMLVTSIIKLIEFEAQSRFRYPFLNFPEYGNRWKWFYYGNKYITQTSESPFNLNSTRIKKDEYSYVQGLKYFLGSYHKETIDSEISDNLLQLYLLQVHNFYKNKFYLRLLKYNKWALKIILIFTIIYIAFLIISMLSCPAIILFLIPPGTAF